MAAILMQGAMHTSSSHAPLAQTPLGEILVSQKRLTDEQLQNALTVQKRSGGRLAVVSLCIGIGQGLAVVIERV